MHNFINPCLSKLSPFIVMEILEKANQMQRDGIDVIHLEVGEPDFDPPHCVTKAACEAIAAGETHYTHSLGTIQLRKELAHFYKTEYNVSVNPECIIATSGSSPAILLALMALCPAGDEVIISNPGYSCYRNFILSIGGIPVDVPLYPENGYQYNPDDIKKAITAKTRAIFVNSPMNPTGTLVNDDVFKFLSGTGIPIISDEIYHGLVYTGKERSILEFTDKALVVSGFSKRFAMTGFRLGYLIVPEYLVRPIQILQQNLFICAPSMAQAAGIAALNNAKNDVTKMRNIYNERRIFMLKRLSEMGFKIVAEPAGAFYIFCDARQFTDDSYRFAFDVLGNAHVGITPGTDFGSRGEGFVRFSYANSIERISEGMDRIKRFLSTYSG
jgi:(5-formylfuran-3-yl)methyl phosphate transaminase